MHFRGPNCIRLFRKMPVHKFGLNMATGRTTTRMLADFRHKDDPFSGQGIDSAQASLFSNVVIKPHKTARPFLAEDMTN